jgi:hypothetical protein
MKYTEIDLFFARLYDIEKRVRKTKKELETIAKYLTPAECDKFAEGCDEIIALRREIKATLTSAPANPDAPPYRKKTKAAYLKIYRDTWRAEREQRERESHARVEQMIREIEEGKRPPPPPPPRPWPLSR